MTRQNSTSIKVMVMLEFSPSVNQTLCRVRQVDYCLPSQPCDLCKHPSERFTTATRTAIDLDLNALVLLQVTVSVHHCPDCRHYFRAQPPFLRPRAIYTNRVVDKAVQSVYNDDMAMRRVTERLARDFWVRPSESMIRHWCRTYSAQFDFEVDYQSWVVSELSGILCVDEVYQDQLALLLAVDPAAPDGDRLVGYRLVHGNVNSSDMEQFLSHLREAGVDPDQVITDGSQLYPAVLPCVAVRRSPIMPISQDSTCNESCVESSQHNPKNDPTPTASSKHEGRRPFA